MESFEQEEEWNSIFLEQLESIPSIDDDQLHIRPLPLPFVIPLTTLYRPETIGRFLVIPLTGALFTTMYDPQTQNLPLQMSNLNNNLWLPCK